MTGSVPLNPCAVLDLIIGSRPYVVPVDGSGSGGACNVYLFSSANTDSLQLGSPFTGNLKVIIAATSETGMHPDIIAGRQGDFVASTDLLNDPQWVQYEISASAIDYLVDSSLTGRVKYAKDNVWYQLGMGKPSTPPVDPPTEGSNVWSINSIWRSD